VCARKKYVWIQFGRVRDHGISIEGKIADSNRQYNNWCQSRQTSPRPLQGAVTWRIEWHDPRAIFPPILKASWRYLHCVPTCDHVVDDACKSNENCPFTKIFDTLITKAIGHRRVFLVSRLTYIVQLLYLEKLSRPKYHEFSPKLLIFPMLRY